jgi:potassium/hydrogen antiporter
LPLLELSGTTLLLLILGLVLLVGFASDFLASRLRIADVIWLMLLGLLIGPVLGLISSSEMLVFAPILGVAALVLILFDAGLDMRFDWIRSVLRPAFAFSGISYGIAAAILFLGTYAAVPSEGIPAALLFGLALGCTSGAIVIPLTKRLRISEDLGRLAQLDGAFEDTFAIVAVTALLYVVSPTGGGGSAFHLALALALPIPVGVAVGAVAGVLWLEFLSAWQEEPYSALATLGFLLVIYGVTEALGGSGVIAALVLGIVLANEASLSRWLGRRRVFRISPSLRKVQGELAFLLRSFFLFLLGLLVDPRALSPLLWASLGAATVILFLVRWRIALKIGGPSSVRALWAPALAGLYGRGLTSAVLIVVAFNRIPEAGSLILPAVLLVLLTNVLMTVWLLYLGRTGRLPRSSQERPPASGADVYVFAPEPGDWQEA